MTSPTPPLSLPPLVFLMSDHETRDLSCAVAEALYAQSSMVVIEDFRTPIFDSLAAMFDVDWKHDFGAAAPVMTDALEGKDFTDLVNSLEMWFVTQFDSHKLGRMALARVKERSELSDNYTTVFRDATQEHVTAFVDDPATAKRDMMFVHFGMARTVGRGTTEIFVSPNAAVDDVISAIKKVL